MASHSIPEDKQGVRVKLAGWAILLGLLCIIGLIGNSYIEGRKSAAQAIEQTRVAAQVEASQEAERAAAQAQEHARAIEVQQAEEARERQERERRGRDLIEAVSSGCDDPSARTLIAQGADLTLLDYNDRTALMLASRYGCVEIVRLLLEHVSEINYMNMWGMTALDWAQRENQQGVADLLIKNGAGPGTRYK